MCYPYDGIRSLIEQDNNYIKYLEEENKRLKELNEKYLKLLIKYEIKEFIEEKKVENEQLGRSRL